MYFGKVLVYFSLIASILSLGCFILNTKDKTSVRQAAERFFYASGVSIAIACVLLFVAFLTDRFDLNYIYGYSSRDLPLMYKIASFWAGQEGTFLLWSFLLVIFGSLIIRAEDKYEDILLAVIVITKIFILVVLTIHSPFRYIWEASPNFKAGLIPHDGTGLNPLLQNPWMMIHPPVLFLGYASATIHFAYAIAALVNKEYREWVERSYKWVVFCMTTLGIGIFLGGYWAYVVLGWGGYWGWDPVENSSLIPWLLIVALMHGLIIQKRKGALVKTNLFLAIVSFVLIFYGTFLTRSGVLSDFSVHSFSDLGLSGYLIFFIVFFVLTGLGLFIVRYKSIETAPLSDKIFTEENIINYGVLTLSFYALFILIGTSMPILSKLFMPNPTSVTIHFYNTISIPLGIIILIFLIAASIKQLQKNINKRDLLLISASSVVLSIVFNAYRTDYAPAYIFGALSFFIVIQSILDIINFKTKPVIASRLPHIGVGVLVIGIIASNIHSYSIQKMLTQGNERAVEDAGLTFIGIKESLRSSLVFNYRDGDDTERIETAYYTDMKTNSLYREPHIDYGFFRDVYIAPVEYISGEENRGRVVLAAGQEGEIEGIKVRFTGFDVDKEKMMAGTPVIYARLNVIYKGKNYSLSPGAEVKGQNVKNNIDVKIPGTSRIISLQNWDIGRRSVGLYVEPDSEAHIAPDRALVEVSFKRLIWLVWFGTILISIGGFYACRRAMISAGK